MYYDSRERPEEVWAEHSDGSCRWRQTGSELKIIALQARTPWFALMTYERVIHSILFRWTKSC